MIWNQTPEQQEVHLARARKAVVDLEIEIHDGPGKIEQLERALAVLRERMESAPRELQVARGYERKLRSETARAKILKAIKELQSRIHGLERKARKVQPLSGKRGDHVQGHL